MKKAFTLLEVIIVIIIVGVLASLALPRFMRLIEGARAVEAVVAIGSIRQALERFYLSHNGTYLHGITGMSEGALLDTEYDLNYLDIDSPWKAPNAHFKYWAYVSTTEPKYLILAIRNSRDSGPENKFIAMGYGWWAQPSAGAPGWTLQTLGGTGGFTWTASDVYAGSVPK